MNITYKQRNDRNDSNLFMFAMCCLHGTTMERPPNFSKYNQYEPIAMFDPWRWNGKLKFTDISQIEINRSAYVSVRVSSSKDQFCDSYSACVSGVTFCHLCNPTFGRHRFCGGNIKVLIK